MNRQQRRAQERANAKVKIISHANPLTLCVAAALPFLTQPQHPPVQSIAINCSEQAQSSSSSNAAAGPGVAKPEKGVTKKCWKCKEVKPVSEFGQNAETYDGLRSACRACERIESKERKARRAAGEAPRTIEARCKELDRPVRYKHCNTCGAKQQDRHYRRDANGLMGLADICRLCEAMQAVERGDIKPQYDKDLRAQIDREHESTDSRLEIRPLFQKQEPLPEHQRHESGWPKNPFKGIQKAATTPLPPKASKRPLSGPFGKGACMQSTETQEADTEPLNDSKHAIA